MFPPAPHIAGVFAGLRRPSTAAVEAKPLVNAADGSVGRCGENSRDDRAQKRGSPSGLPHRLGTRYSSKRRRNRSSIRLVNDPPEPLARFWRGAPWSDPARSRPPVNPWPGDREDDAAEHHQEAENGQDREAADHGGLERHAANQHRQTDHEQCRALQPAPRRGCAQSRHRERSTRTWGPRHRARSRSGRACAAHDRRVACVPPCRPVPSGSFKRRVLPAFAGN